MESVGTVMPKHYVKHREKKVHRQKFPLVFFMLGIITYLLPRDYPNKNTIANYN